MIGYACMPLGFRDYSFKKVLKKNLSKENLELVIENNLDSLENILEYNIKNDIKLFRISSDLIPFGDFAIEYLDYLIVYKDRFKQLGEKIKENNLRVSFHPGQYTVLNSNNTEVVEKAVLDLYYHTSILDAMNLDKSHKIILHVGGVYGDKKSAIERFIENYEKLDNSIKDRLIIENDDKSYNVEDLLYINKRTGVTLIFDNLHNSINSSEKYSDEFEIIKLFGKTWKKSDGRQKIHYSQQDKNKKKGSHSRTIDIKEFKEFYDNLNMDIDIMLEVKDKDLSAIKCNNLFRNHIKYLEKDWAKYKYNILEHSQKDYLSIRNLLKDRENYNVLKFYEIIDNSLEKEINKNEFLNSSNHVWGYFKNTATIEEKEKMKKYFLKYKSGKISSKPIKEYLLELAKKYNSKYLLDSYYFNF